MNPSLYQCPKCHSDNTQSFPMIYQSGTSHGNFKAVSVGLTAGVIGTGGKTHNQSSLAQSTAPPIKPAYPPGYMLGALAVAGIGIGLITAIMESVFVNIGVDKSYGLTCGLLIGSIPGLYIASLGYWKLSDATNKWKDRIRQYENSWMCLRCGNSWYLPNGA